ncbi:type II secretion system protein GspM [Xenophilus arseniciresistens]|uniref:Type II secretion system protein GspM n=1 Tax=Xenophilus arseniciresistens TaxID=1283306 RepID=A0AAE3N742_9BURK|nr:type II secretion system protein GspM [Xenophilus arseniciresistens]MDA7416785.1 type II secretion system protein GspM [Xenophilus arseniciresistens]
MSFANMAAARLRGWWSGLTPQERRLVGIAAAVVGLALLWWVALAPALRTLATAPQEHARLDAQLQQMRALQTQARALQSQPRAERQDAIRALEASLQGGLGGQAQMQAQAGDAVGVALRQVPADALAGWLAQARANARAVPRELRLTRSTQPAPVQAAPAVPAAPPGPPNRSRTLPRTPEAAGAAPASAAAAAAAAPPAPIVSGPPQIRWEGTLVLALPAP